jgi:hypothetical protein
MTGHKTAPCVQNAAHPCLDRLQLAAKLACARTETRRLCRGGPLCTTWLPRLQSWLRDERHQGCAICSSPHEGEQDGPAAIFRRLLVRNVTAQSDPQPVDVVVVAGAVRRVPPGSPPPMGPGPLRAAASNVEVAVTRQQLVLSHVRWRASAASSCKSAVLCASDAPRGIVFNPPYSCV